MNRLFIFGVATLAFGAVAFAEYSTTVTNITTGKATRKSNVALGEAKALTLAAAESTPNLTTGSAARSQPYAFVELTTYLRAAVSTINGIAGTVEGDVVVLQTARSSEDVVVIEGTNLKLGGASRTLTNVSDQLILVNYDGTNLREQNFSDND